MGSLFDLCVHFLKWLGNMVGMSYVEINIWIFCIIEPLIFILMLYIIIRQAKKIKILNAYQR